MSFTSTLDRLPSVSSKRDVILSGGRKSQVQERRHPSHAVRHNQMTVFTEQQFTDVPTNLLRNSGTMYRAQLYRGRFSKIKHAVLKMTITLNGAVNLCPMTHWFQRIEIRASGNSQSVYSIDSDALITQTMLLLKKPEMRGVLKQAGFCPDERWMYAESDTIASGAVTTFSMPLLGFFWQSIPHYFRNAKNDWIIEFTPASTVSISGTNSNVDVSAMSLFIESEALDEQDAIYHENVHRNISTTVQYLEPVLVAKESVTVTAGSVYNLDLSSLRGKMAFLAVFARANSATNSDNGMQNYLQLGEESANIDLTDAGGKSLWGSGTAVDARWIRNELWCHHASNDFAQVKAIHLIPFCHHAGSSFAGRVDGYYEFTAADKCNLAIKPGAALTATVFTVTQAAAAAAGYVRLKYKDSLSDDLAFNTSAANLKVAFDALKDARREGVTSTFSAALSAGATVTITMSANYVYSGPESMPQVLAFDEAAAAATNNAVTTRTTVGNHGWTTGSVSLYCYAWKFKEITSLDGQVKVSDL